MVPSATPRSAFLRKLNRAASSGAIGDASRPSQLPPDEVSRAQAHLGTCSDCQARLADMQELVGLLRALPSIDPPRDFRLGPRLVADPPNVIRLRRWYAWTRAGAGALAAAFVFLSVGTLYVDSRSVPSSATLASKAQPGAPEVASAPQNSSGTAPQTASAPAARNAAGAAASDAAQPGAAAPAAQPPASAAAPGPPAPASDAAAPAAPPAPASAARPAAVPAASPAAQAPGAAAGAPAPAPPGAAVRSQAAPAPTSTEPDQIAAATTVRPLPTQAPTPTLMPQPTTPFASAAPAQAQADPAAPLRVAASVVGVLAAFGILLALFVRHRLQAASPSHLE